VLAASRYSPEGLNWGATVCVWGGGGRGRGATVCVGGGWVGQGLGGGGGRGVRWDRRERRWEGGRRRREGLVLEVGH
jgi:hypothetical protein